MATITITYTPAEVFKNDVATQQIFGVWNPATTASDNPVFYDTVAKKPTYYQTNRWDNGEFPYATTLEEFLAAQIAHPGLVAALLLAAKNGSYVWENAPDDMGIYIDSIGDSLADQGFSFGPGSSSSAEG